MKDSISKKISRREFLRCIFTGIIGVYSIFGVRKLFGAELPLMREGDSAQKGRIFPQEAMYYRKLNNKLVQCLLCPRQCELSPGQTGFCRTRENREGRLYTNAFSNPCAVFPQPCEKEPLYHFLPGTMSLSIATAGCNFRCLFCWNWLISQFSPKQTTNYLRSPQDIIELAIMQGCASVHYTYAEPVSFYEYMLEISKLAKQTGIKNVYHSNGYINEGPLRQLCKYLDAVCIDLKGFSEEYYQETCNGTLEPVLKSLKIIREERPHLEIVNLIVPHKNDNPETIKKMCQWIVENLGPNIPVHFSRFYPRYRLKNLEPTPITTLEKAREIALSCGINYSFINNMPDHPGEDTYCPKCKKKIIDRQGYYVLENNLISGKCKYCGLDIAGVF